MIAIQPVEHLIEAVLGGDGHMAMRLFDLIFDPLRHGGMSTMCGFGFGEKLLHTPWAAATQEVTISAVGTGRRDLRFYGDGFPDQEDVPVERK